MKCSASGTTDLENTIVNWFTWGIGCESGNSKNPALILIAEASPCVPEHPAC